MAKLQKFLFYFSWLILFSSLLLRLFTASGDLPLPLSLLQSVLLTGAIGFLTNYLAIEMLFRPYAAEDASWRNILSPTFWRSGGLLRILTLGFWKTGLVSANKDQIGRKLGEEIPARLLHEGDLADQLLNELPMMPARQPDFFPRIREILRRHTVDSPEFIRLLTESLTSGTARNCLQKILSADLLKKNMKTFTGQWFLDEQNQDFLFRAASDEAEKNMVFLRGIIRRAVEDGAHTVLQKQSPLLAMLGGSFLDNALADYDWSQIDALIREKLQDRDIRLKFRDFCGTVPERIDVWCASDAGQSQLVSWTEELSRSLEPNLSEKMPEIIRIFSEELLNSEQLEQWFTNSFLPALQGELQKWLRDSGKDQILKTLDLSRRIEEAVSAQDVREFHQMVNAVADRHLCAIQILGFFIGVVIGLIQLL